MARQSRQERHDVGHWSGCPGLRAFRAPSDPTACSQQCCFFTMHLIAFAVVPVLLAFAWLCLLASAHFLFAGLILLACFCSQHYALQVDAWRSSHIFFSQKDPSYKCSSCAKTYSAAENDRNEQTCTCGNMLFRLEAIVRYAIVSASLQC